MSRTLFYLVFKEKLLRNARIIIEKQHFKRIFTIELRGTEQSVSCHPRSSSEHAITFNYISAEGDPPGTKESTSIGRGEFCFGYPIIFTTVDRVNPVWFMRITGAKMSTVDVNRSETFPFNDVCSNQIFVLNGAASVTLNKCLLSNPVSYWPTLVKYVRSNRNLVLSFY